MESPIDSLRISPRECDDILRSIRQIMLPKDSGQCQRGEHDRIEIENEVIAVLKTRPPEGRPIQFQVRCRNISNTGIGFFHGQFIHEKTPCELILINTQHEGFAVHGHVVRCRLIEKHIHEIGIAFTQPIDSRRVVGNAA